LNILVEVGDVTLSLSAEEARGLWSQLNTIFGGQTKWYSPHILPYKVTSTGDPVIYPTNTVSSAWAVLRKNSS